MSSPTDNPALLVAFGIAAAAVIFAFLFGLSYVIPSVGIAISLATTGTAMGFTIAPALAPVITYGMAATGGVLVIHLTVSVVKGIEKQPLMWGAPILGVLSGFLVQTCEKFWHGPEIMWPVFALVSALMVIIGGVMYGGPSITHKILGVLMSLVPPVVVFFSVENKDGVSPVQSIASVPLTLWSPLLLMLFLAIVLGIIAHLDYKKKNP